MTLQVGTTLGPYEVTAKIGEGGMGEVYKARDTRLDRTVAIKVLPEHVAADPDLKARFEREAKTVAALSHPHICPVFDVGEQDGINFLVMEYLDGETLAERLVKGAIPVDRALQIAIEIADALDKAHRQGIVHRDLKPGNIMLTKAGTKLLDFGLAKLTAIGGVGPLSVMPTQSADLTGEGTVIGTVQYMAPEQLEGKTVDARTDVFAFGTTVYEMVTGNKAFAGESRASLIGAILRDEPPPMVSLQSMSPPALEVLVRTCLTKDPEGRWHSLGDVARQLKVMSTVPPAMGSRSAEGSTPGSGTVGKVAAVFGVGVVVSGLAVWGLLRPEGTPAELMRLTVALPEIQGTAVSVRGPSDLAIAADGTFLVFRGAQPTDSGTQLYLRRLDQLAASPLPGTENAITVFLPPSGEWIGFARQTATLERVSIFGGVPETLATLPTGLRGASWGDDDQIIVGTESGGLFRVPAGGGPPEAVTELEADRGEVSHEWPSVVAGRRAALFVIDRGESGAVHELAAVDLDTGDVSRLGLAGTSPRYVSTGHLIYVANDRTLRAVSFDAEALRVSGTPVTILDGIMLTPWAAANFSVSDDGRLIYMSETTSDGLPGWRLVWVDRRGQVVSELADRLNAPWPRLSPDGTRAAFTVAGDIWIRDLERDVSVRFTEGGGLLPTWSPDGASVTFNASRTGGIDLFAKPTNGRGPAELLAAVGQALTPGSYSPDGTALVFHAVNPETQRDLWVVRPGSEPESLLVTEFNESNPRISPDGQWMTYSSDQSGEYRIYARRFPDSDGVIPVSEGPGTQAVWSRDGEQLFYRNRNQMLVTAVDASQDLRIGETTVLFEEPYVLDPTNSATQTYDVSLDGQRFLMVHQPMALAGEITLVLDWFEDLKARVPVD